MIVKKLQQLRRRIIDSLAGRGNCQVGKPNETGKIIKKTPGKSGRREK